VRLARSIVGSWFSAAIAAAVIAGAPCFAAEPTPLAPAKALEICFSPTFADAVAAAANLGWDAMSTRQLASYRIGLLINALASPQTPPPADLQADAIVRAAGWRSPGAGESSEMALVQSEYGLAAGFGCHLTESVKRSDLEPALIERLGVQPVFRGKAGNVTSTYWSGQTAAVLLSFSGAEGDTSYLAISRRKPGK
jgi:hypothetical protein